MKRTTLAIILFILVALLLSSCTRILDKVCVETEEKPLFVADSEGRIIDPKDLPEMGPIPPKK